MANSEAPIGRSPNKAKDCSTDEERRKPAAKRDGSSEAAGVGFRKPPKHSQFKKGQSGNPRGRPPKKHPFQAVKDRLLSDIQVVENGKKKRVSVLDEITRKAINAALQGKFREFEGMIRILTTLGLTEQLKYPVQTNITVKFVSPSQGKNNHGQEAEDPPAPGPRAKRGNP